MNLHKMLSELLSLKEIGCTYDFKERFEVALSTLEVLDLVKVIRTKIPACGDHCERTITDYLINSRIIDQISSLLIGESDLTKERLVTSLLKETKLSLQAIRTTIKDILDLLVSAQIIGIKEGTIIITSPINKKYI